MRNFQRRKNRKNPTIRILNRQYHTACLLYTSDIRVSLDSEYLAQLTEKETGILHIALTGDDTTLCSEDVDITALAFDEWHGYGFYPEDVYKRQEYYWN